MTDTQRASQIPFMSPRTLSSPTTLLSPNLGLISPSRYPSVSGRPTLPGPRPHQPVDVRQARQHAFPHVQQLPVARHRKQQEPSIDSLPVCHPEESLQHLRTLPPAHSFNTLHLQQYAGIGSCNGLSHKSSFLYVFLCSKFVWYSFPGYIFHWALSYFN